MFDIIFILYYNKNIEFQGGIAPVKKKHGDKNKLTVLEIASYSLGSLGGEVGNSCVNSFLLVYLCIYMHLNPLYMTVAFVLAKLWDAINDPMLATLVNNCKKSRFGRYRPWILGGAIANAVTLVLLFYPISAPSEGIRYVYYITMYVLWGMSFTVLDVPFWSMLPTIANTTDERNRASSFVRLIGGFGGFTMNSIGTSVILPIFASKGMEKAYLILGMVASAMLVAFVSFTVIGNREKYEIPHSRIGFKTITDLFKTNDQLRAYSLSYVLYQTGSTIAISQILYLYVFCYENGANYLNSTYSYTLFWIIACTGQGIAMFFYSWITKKIPREKIYGVAYILQIFSLIMLFFIFFVLKPGKEYHLINSVLVALSGSCMMLANGMNQIGSTVMIADVVDYGEWKTGIRGDSVIFSVQTLLSKFAGAISMLILGLGISAAGLPNIREYFDPVLEKTVQQFVDSSGNIVDATAMINGDALLILRVFMFLIPIPLCILGLIIYRKKYWLYGEKYQKIKAEIDERRASVSK